MSLASEQSLEDNWPLLPTGSSHKRVGRLPFISLSTPNYSPFSPDNKLEVLAGPIAFLFLRVFVQENQDHHCNPKQRK